MIINKNVEGTTTVLGLAGRLDTSTAAKLEEAVDECIKGVETLVFDCEKLEYISSAGLRVVLKAKKIMNTQGKLKFININETIMEVFDITGFADILDID